MRKRLVTLALFLFLGALINIAIAWGWAYRRPVWAGDYKPYWDRYATVVTSPTELPRWMLNWLEQGCARVYIWNAEYSEITVETGRGALGDQDEMEYIDDQSLIPRWTTVGHQPPPFDSADPNSHWLAFVEYAAGWPLLAVFCRFDTRYDLPTDNTYLADVHGGIALDRQLWPKPTPGAIWIHGTLPDRGALPYWPIWPGFVVNSVFYAVPLLLLFHTPLWLRGRMRKLRNRCPACAYPIGTSAICTECGYQLLRIST